jgi:hypothetical protein
MSTRGNENAAQAGNRNQCESHDALLERFVGMLERS